MNYEEFKNYIKEHLIDAYKAFTLGNPNCTESEKRTIIDGLKGAEVVIQEVVKNNGIKYDALSMYANGRNTSPNIPIRPFYDSLITGVMPLDFIMADIVRNYDNLLEGMNCYQIDFSDYERVKDKIVIRLINYDKNKELLEKCVYKKYLDLAITYRYILSDVEDGISSVIITKAEFESWDIDEVELYEKALSNTKELYPGVVVSMSEIIKEACRKNLKDFLGEDFEIPDSEFDSTLYVLTNTHKIFGAGCILYDDVIRNFAEERNANIYIIPSSIHETMLIEDKEVDDPEYISDLLADANMKCVSTIDLLSDNVYFYDREKDEISIYKFQEQSVIAQ